MESIQILMTLNLKYKKKIFLLVIDHGIKISFIQ